MADVGPREAIQMTANSINELERLKENLRIGALASLKNSNPEYVERFMTNLAAHKDPITDTKTLLRGDELSHWIPILEAFFELEQRLRELRSSLEMLRMLPDTAIINAYGMSPGAWITYHLHASVVTLHSLLECAEKLATRVIRRLVRGSRAEKKAHERRLVDNTLHPLRDIVANYRGKVAHTEGSGIEGLTEEQFWGPYLLLPDIDLLESRDQAVIQFHQQWCAMVRETSIQAIAVVFAVAQDVNSLAFQGANTNVQNHEHETGEKKP